MAFLNYSTWSFQKSPFESVSTECFLQSAKPRLELAQSHLLLVFLNEAYCDKKQAFVYHNADELELESPDLEFPEAVWFLHSPMKRY